MGFFNTILDIIANNYIFFIGVTVFLIFSLIGFYVDKKTRKDADITPIFGKKVSLNIKHKDKTKKKDKKSKKGFTTTIVGGETTAPAVAMPVASQPMPVINTQTPAEQVPVGYAQVSTSQQENIQSSQMPIQTANNNIGNIGEVSQPVPITNEYNQSLTQVQTLPDGTVVDSSLLVGISNPSTSGQVIPAAATAQIAETVLPNVATTPVQASVQGISASAPGMESIIPNVQPQTPNLEPSTGFENQGEKLDIGVEDSDSAMNFNMSEE